MITRNITHKNLGPKVLFHYRKKMAKFIPVPYFKVSEPKRVDLCLFVSCVPAFFDLLISLNKILNYMLVFFVYFLVFHSWSYKRIS